MLGVFAEIETNLRRERQLKGIAKAKAAGVYKAAGLDRRGPHPRIEGAAYAAGRDRQDARDRPQLGLSGPL
jgi:DNA invertase Pin-like site-specific DNA recombinase